MRRLKLWLLGVTASFNLLFWPLFCQHYQLKGFVLGYPNTVVVGSVPLVLLAYLSVSVRQTLVLLTYLSAGVRPTLPPRPARSLHWLSLWPARSLLVLLKLGIWVLAALLGWFFLTVLGLFPWWLRVLTVLPTYVGSVLLFHSVALVLHEAALPKPVARFATTLAAVSLVLAFAWLGAWVFLIAEGTQPSCSQRFVSPSGQRTLVLKTRDDWIDGDPTSYAYVESGLWRRELPAPLNGHNICTDASLRVQWSVDEKQINWQNSAGHGHW